ncbi:MAG: hypothetical protein IIW54_00530 [Lachnospiraceae bacterium]|nr:hypothetical protein [Lachnospiraceae bacterium]MBQ5849298.1 hypothetical protein [Lachnospiraceae bacterium]
MVIDVAQISEEKLQKLKDEIQDAQFVLVGIGEEFNEDFKNIAKFPKLMSALEEVDIDEQLIWTVPFLEKLYLSKNNEGRYIDAYKGLFELIKDKNYFIVTTCIDENIKKAGFDAEKIVEPCGNYENLQCSDNCSDELHSSLKYADLIEQALEDGVGLDSVLEPVCPKCGKKMVLNNIICEKYSEQGYKPQWEKYTKWLQLTLNRKLCILELGVGMNLPNIIRWPFEKVAFYNQKAKFFRINETLFQLTQEIAEKGESIEMNAVDFLANLK